MEFNNKATDHQTANSGRNNWLPWALVVVLGFALINQLIGGGVSKFSLTGIAWLPLLAGLICPLMMLFMMSGHGHGGHGSGSGNEQQNNDQGSCCGGNHKK